MASKYHQRKYILCLHPAPGTSLYMKLNGFWSRSREFYDREGSHSFSHPFHVALTSYFTIRYSHLRDLVNVGENIFSGLPDFPVRHSYGYLVPPVLSIYCDNNTGGIRMQAPDIHKAVGKLTELISCAKIKAVSGRSLHLTLYHNISYDIASAMHMQGQIASIQCQPWARITIGLWEIHGANWKLVHAFGRQKRCDGAARVVAEPSRAMKLPTLLEENVNEERDRGKSKAV